MNYLQWFKMYIFPFLYITNENVPTNTPTIIFSL